MSERLLPEEGSDDGDYEEGDNDPCQCDEREEDDITGDPNQPAHPLCYLIDDESHQRHHEDGGDDQHRCDPSVQFEPRPQRTIR